MAVNGVMFFKPFGAEFLASEDQVNIADDTSDLGSIMNLAGVGKLFEIENFNFDIEQTLDTGSQSTGAGAGKVAFNPFSITRKVDLISRRSSRNPVPELHLSRSPWVYGSLLEVQSPAGSTSFSDSS